VRIVVTGSNGHLGEALVRTLLKTAHPAVGIDRKASAFTACVGTITDRDFVRRCVRGADALVHTATLHKPHLVTHTPQDFIDTNVTGTLDLLEEAVSAWVSSFVFTSTTSVFGGRLGSFRRWTTIRRSAERTRTAT
jgi:nucleoside-diphosphate-sugar epimerase